MRSTRELARREAKRDIRGLELAVDWLLDGGMDYRDAFQRFQRAYIRRSLVRTSGNVTKASKMIGVHRNTFARLIEASGLQVANVAKLKKPNTAPAVAARQTRRAA